MKNLKRKKEMSMFELVDILATPDLRGKLYNFLVKALDAPFEDLDDIRYWLETPVQCGEEIQKYVHKRVAAMEAEHAKMTRCNCPAK
ncbi:MAG: hypothetical protein ACRCXX_09565, partial [Cetobacterium sp.]|uniref:hypothetical protein n=1 Tax=Cetobacterium sp. TaxID=2071632 RepID=UPI003F2AAA02